MRVPDIVKKCVVYLGFRQNETSAYFGGTGFFVNVLMRESNVMIYLVTAKHVADKINPNELAIRANTKDGKAVMFSGGNGNLKWHFHSDSTVDVAVMEWAPPAQANIDFLHIDSRMFLPVSAYSAEAFGIGDEVCIVGLFSHHEGESAIEPMLRIGNIAMIPKERVKTSWGKMEAYLIEARSIGGLSGSPVFVTEEHQGDDLRIVRSQYLMGLIHGHWNVSTDNMPDFSQEDSTRKENVNMGIAIVTPASKILDILNNDELSKKRKDWTEQNDLRNPPKTEVL